jgi:hypothetical protein
MESHLGNMFEAKVEGQREKFHAAFLVTRAVERREIPCFVVR